MTDSQETTAWIKAMPVVFVLIWSTGFIVARYGMPHAPPFSFLLVRYLLSILCFLPWIFLARVKWPQSRMQLLHLAVTGILMHAGYLGGVWVAVRAGMGSGLSALVVGLQPVLTALWLSANGGQVNKRQWLGLVLGFGPVKHPLSAGNHELHRPLHRLHASIGQLHGKVWVELSGLHNAHRQCLQAIQLGLGIEQVNMARPAFEEDPNNGLGFGSDMGDAGGQGVEGGR